MDCETLAGGVGIDCKKQTLLAIEDGEISGVRLLLEERVAQVRWKMSQMLMLTNKKREKKCQTLLKKKKEEPKGGFYKKKSQKTKKNEQG